MARASRGAGRRARNQLRGTSSAPARGVGAPTRDDRAPTRDDRAPARDDRAPARDDRAPARDDRAPVRPAPPSDRDRPREPSSEPTSRPDPLIGRTLAGKYTIVELLGEGAMGRVYRARQTALDKEVAVKVLHRHLTGDERIEKRFHREARAASRLAHPNSIDIHDFGTTDDGTLYIAMELLDGEDLQTIIDHDHPFSPARIAALLVPVLRALEEAHRAGIIHRDLKPENVVVQPDRSGREHVKVCDFGIAKILDQDEGRTLTVDGFVCGTPQYMAPEQGRGDVLDHRGDIYAAGVVLYQMLCGVVPFEGENALGIMTRHLVEAPKSPSERAPQLGIPRALESVCMRALRKSPAERWQTAAEMADALERAVAALGADAESRLGEGPFRGSTSGKRTRPRRWFLRAFLPVAALLVALAWWSLRTTPLDAPRRVPPTAAAPAQDAEPVAPRQEPSAPPSTPEADTVVPSRASEPASPRETPPRDEPPREPPVEPGSAPTEVHPPLEPRASGSRPLGPRARREPIAEPPTTAPPASPGLAAFEEGRRLFLANDVPGAIASFEEAARLTPERAEVHKQLGRAYMRAGDLPRSIAAYRRYLELAPDDAPDRAVIERIISRQGG